MFKNSTINNNYEDGTLKNVNIAAKRLFDENFHDWKMLPLHIIHNSLGKKFVFYSNIRVNKKVTKSFPKYFEKFLTPGVVNSYVKHLYHQQFYLSSYGLTVKSK